jgi:hypothetical protein|tara:strand:- start:86 stop:625 length:540 start_codon:yes stop_codon:yes gene_type:complete
MALHQVIDNFLSYPQYKQLKEVMTSSDFPWYFTPYVASTTPEQNNEDAYQFVHPFWMNKMGFYNPNTDKISDILMKINPQVLLKCKANLQPKSHNVRPHEWHTDFTPPLADWTTAIYYMNDNNGYTEFKDGDIINSVANRIVFFNGLNEHRGTTCTDTKARIVINFNFIGGEHAIKAGN